MITIILAKIVSTEPHIFNMSLAFALVNTGHMAILCLSWQMGHPNGFFLGGAVELNKAGDC